MNKLKDKYKLDHIESGHTPDGYSIYERIQLEDKNSRDHIEIHKGGGAAYFMNGNEHTHDKEAYQDMGIDTDTKEFKDFELGLKKDENYNTKYIEDFLKNAPELTTEKRQEIDKQRFEDIQKQVAADKEYQANGGFIAEMKEQEDKEVAFLGEDYKEQIKDRISDQEFENIVDNAVEDAMTRPSTFTNTNEDSNKEVEHDIVNGLNKIIEDRNLGEPVVAKEIYQKQQELSENGKTEVAKPGRTYTGNVIEVGEDVTVQQTKTGKFIIHETENLPGIKEQDSNISAKIIYDAGGKGDIAAKNNDLAIGKEKEIEQKKSHEKVMER